MFLQEILNFWNTSENLNVGYNTLLALDGYIRKQNHNKMQ